MTDHYTAGVTSLDNAVGLMQAEVPPNEVTAVALIALTRGVLALVDELHACRLDALDMIRNGGLS